MLLAYVCLLIGEDIFAGLLKAMRKMIHPGLRVRDFMLA